jgi:hypothetical protein
MWCGTFWVLRGKPATLKPSRTPGPSNKIIGEYRTVGRIRGRSDRVYGRSFGGQEGQEKGRSALRGGTTVQEQLRREWGVCGVNVCGADGKWYRAVFTPVCFGAACPAACR